MYNIIRMWKGLKIDMHQLMKLRKRWQVSRLTLCRVLGVTRTRYYKLENSQSVEELKRVMTVREMDELAKFFQVTTDELFYEKKQKKG